MMRGIRWQIAALLVSFATFSVVFWYSSQTTPETSAPPITQTAAPAISTDAATVATALPMPTTVPTERISPATDLVRNATTTISAPQADFTEAVAGAVLRFNPLLANPTEQDITSLIYEGLTTINDFGEAVPQLAERWIASRDGYEYVVQLRTDVLWQDGIPFSATDVVYTASLVASPDFPGSPALQQFWQTVEVQQIDDQTIRFRLAQPLGSFPYRLHMPILPEHVLRGTSAAQLTAHPINVHPIGTGPYQLDEIRAAPDGSRIATVTLQKAPTFRFANRYQLNTLAFRFYPDEQSALDALAAGNVDAYFATDPAMRAALAGVEGLTLHNFVAPRIGMLIFNWNEGEDNRFFSDQRIRTALQLAVNKVNPVVLGLFNQAIPVDSPLHLQSSARIEISTPQPDILRARELLGATEGDAAVGSFTILVPQTPAPQRIADELAQQWAQAQLDVQVETVPLESFEQRLIDGDFEAAIVEIAQGADPDAYPYWHVAQHPDGFNYGGVTDTRISELLERARRESNGLNRLALYAEFQQLFVDRAIALPLYQPLVTYAVRDTIQGVQIGFIDTPADRFRSLQDWRSTR